MVPWSGVQFGENGHNKLVRGLLMQVQNGKYCTIYPFEVSACEVLYPMPSWKDKAKMK
jgi:branched-chain amino acid transport system substrate-binding protein